MIATLNAAIRRRPTRRGALGTMDTLLSITAGALFLIGSITIFNKAMSKTAERGLANQATLLVQSVRGFYQNQSTYGDTTNNWSANSTTGTDIAPVLIKSRQLLNEMINGSGLRNSFGGNWTVTGMIDAFAITASNVPVENCSAVLSMLNTSDLRQMRVTAGSTSSDACVENGAGGASPCPATPVSITDACAPTGNTSGVTTIRLVYR
jgi:hypothetical protein